MLRSLHGLEADEGNLHRADETDDKEGVVCHVDAVTKAVHQQENKDMERDQIDDEDVATPGGNHVEVGEGAPGCPEDGSVGVAQEKMLKSVYFVTSAKRRPV